MADAEDSGRGTPVDDLLLSSRSNYIAHASLAVGVLALVFAVLFFVAARCEANHSSRSQTVKSQRNAFLAGRELARSLALGGDMPRPSQAAQEKAERELKQSRQDLAIFAGALGIGPLDDGFSKATRSRNDSMVEDPAFEHARKLVEARVPSALPAFLAGFWLERSVERGLTGLTPARVDRYAADLRASRAELAAAHESLGLNPPPEVPEARLDVDLATKHAKQLDELRNASFVQVAGPYVGGLSPTCKILNLAWARW